MIEPHQEIRKRLFSAAWNDYWIGNSPLVSTSQNRTIEDHVADKLRLLCQAGGIGLETLPFYLPASNQYVLCDSK